jgi:hypothetical protein
MGRGHSRPYSEIKMQVELEYIGKKEPLVFNSKILGRTISWNFRHRGSKVLTEPVVADEILKYNPTGFVKKVGERAVEQTQEKREIIPMLVCPYCEKKYKPGGRGKYFYDIHVQNCPEKLLDEPKEEPEGLINDSVDE